MARGHRSYAFVTQSIAHVPSPALDRLLVVPCGVRTVCAFYMASFSVSATLLSRIHRLPPSRKSSDKTHLEITEAFRYLRTRRNIFDTYFADIAAIVFAFAFALFLLAAEITTPNGSLSSSTPWPPSAAWSPPQCWAGRSTYDITVVLFYLPRFHPGSRHFR